MMRLVYLYLYIFIFALASSAFFVWISMLAARKAGFVAVPREDRLHTREVPLLGGVGIALAFFFTVFLHSIVAVKFGRVLPEMFSWMEPFVHGLGASKEQFAAIMGGGVLMFFLGLIDDLKSLRPLIKLTSQILIAVLLYAFDVRINVFFGGSSLSFMLTVLWIIGITNSFNLLDNMDGLCAGVAAIASFMLFLQCVQSGQILVSLLLVCVVGNLCGYLFFNYPPAKVFMGDAGSLVIGFFVSVLTIKSTFYYSEGISLVPMAAPLLIFAVPIYDTLSVIIIRIRNHKPIYTGDKNHFSHRLLRSGMSVRGALLFIYLIALGLGIAALVMKTSEWQGQVILVVQAVIFISIIYLMERKQKYRE